MAFKLALKGAGSVNPNPMVGAVLVHEGRKIGEGWHQKYGEAHAEVNAVNSVKPVDIPLIKYSTLYVSLEPCSIFGKTPPCTNLILAQGIKKVVYAALDETKEVKGQTKAILEEKGVEVISGLLESEGKWLARRRNIFASQNRPYIILKYATSSDGYMGRIGEKIWLTNATSKRLVHDWRSKESAILVGANTVLNDDPELTVRLVEGKNPLRIVMDIEGKLDIGKKVFNDKAETLWLTPSIKTNLPSNITNLLITNEEDAWGSLFSYLHDAKMSSLIVEGGAYILNSLLRHGWWDEARVFKTSHVLSNGVKAPIQTGDLMAAQILGGDELSIFVRKGKEIYPDLMNQDLIELL